MTTPRSQHHTCRSVEDWIALGAAAGDPDTLPMEALSCPRCLAAQEELDRLLERAGHYDPEVAGELLAAPGLLPELTRGVFTEQLERVAADDRLRTWGLVRILLEDSYAERLKSPCTSYARALVATTMAETLEPDLYHPRWLAGLQAECHAHLGNALRILGEFPVAEDHFRKARRLLRVGLDSDETAARVLNFEVSLLIDQDRLDEAERLLGQLEGLYRRDGRSEELGRVLLKRAKVHRFQDDLVRAAVAAEEAALLLAHVQDPHLPVVARIQAAVLALEAGEIDSARAHLELLPPAREDALGARIRWLQGNLLREEGRLDEARQALEAARGYYLDQSLRYDVALLSLDLALVALLEGRTPEVRELAHQAETLMVECAAPHEALASTRLLVAAFEQDRATTALVKETVRCLSLLRPAGG